MLPLLSHSAIQTKDKSPRKLHITCYQRIWIWKTSLTQMTNDETLNRPLHYSFLLFMAEHKLLILIPVAITQQTSAAEGPLPTPSICMFALSLLVLMEAAFLNTSSSLILRLKRKIGSIASSVGRRAQADRRKKNIWKMYIYRSKRRTVL